MKMCRKAVTNDLGCRIYKLCNYVLSGIERERLQSLHIEVQQAWLRLRALEKELKEMVEKYEGQ